jgi:hypothetical protein
MLQRKGEFSGDPPPGALACLAKSPGKGPRIRPAAFQYSAVQGGTLAAPRGDSVLSRRWSPLGVSFLNMPLAPDAVRRAIREASGARAGR